MLLLDLLMRAPENSAFLRAVRDLSRFYLSKHVVRNGCYEAMLLRLSRTFGRFANSSGSQHMGDVDKSRYSILWFSFMTTSDLSCLWLCMIRTMFCPT